jgi:calcium/calmodulin-dependent protein kinase I
MTTSRPWPGPRLTSSPRSVSGMINKLQGQPDSYDKKYDIPPVWHASIALTRDRNSYRFGKTLGAGTYGIVREADQNGQRYAIKIILKKNIRGNEQMVYDELEMLQRMNHANIVHFHDWFESRVCRHPIPNHASDEA